MRRPSGLISPPSAPAALLASSLAESEAAARSWGCRPSASPRHMSRSEPYLRPRLSALGHLLQRARAQTSNGSAPASSPEPDCGGARGINPWPGVRRSEAAALVWGRHRGGYGLEKSHHRQSRHAVTGASTGKLLPRLLAYGPVAPSHGSRIDRGDRPRSRRLRARFVVDGCGVMEQNKNMPFTHPIGRQIPQASLTLHCGSRSVGIETAPDDRA
jgi:hypothetical protein